MLDRREGVHRKGKVIRVVPLSNEAWHDLGGQPISWIEPSRPKDIGFDDETGHNLAERPIEG